MVAFALALLLDCPGGALAESATLPPSAHPIAQLHGRAIELAEVVQYHCHDLAAPVYRCFDTAQERDGDMGSALASGSDSSSDSALTSIAYVLFFEHSNYGGSSLAVSQPTPDLGALGWSNAISSFKSTNGGRPKWWDGVNYSASWWQWTASAWVAYVGDAANDRFTSVKNVP